VQDIVTAQRNVFPSLLSPFIRDEIGELVVALGGGGMRFGRESTMPFARFSGDGIDWNSVSSWCSAAACAGEKPRIGDAAGAFCWSWPESAKLKVNK